MIRLKILRLASETHQNSNTSSYLICLKSDSLTCDLRYDMPKNVFGEEGHHFSQQCQKLIKEYEPGENINNFIKVLIFSNFGKFSQYWPTGQ